MLELLRVSVSLPFCWCTFVYFPSNPIAFPHDQVIIFGVSQDHVLRAALKGHRNFVETLQMSGPAELLDEVRAAHKEDYVSLRESTSDLAPAPAQLVPEADAHMVLASPPRPSGSVTAADVQVEDVIQEVPAIDEERLAAFRAQARRTVATHVKLLAVDDLVSEGSLVAELNDSAVGRYHGKLSAEGSPTEFLGIFFDVKLAGEALTAPHTRVPPLKDGRLAKLMCIILKSRAHDAESQKPVLDPADLFFFMDGCKRGLAKLGGKGNYQSMKLAKKVLQIYALSAVSM